MYLKFFSKSSFLRLSACEDHRGQQPIEKDLLVEIDVFDIFAEEHQEAENQAYQNADSCFMYHMNLSEGRGTCLC